MFLKWTILVNFLPFLVYSSRTKPPRGPFYYPDEVGTQEQFIIDINKMRRDYAKKFNVSNMHQLNWDKDLNEIVQYIDMETDYLNFLYPWVLCYSNGYTDVIELMDRDFTFYIELEKEEKRKPVMDSSAAGMKTLDLLAPLQTILGCEVVGGKSYDMLHCFIGFQSTVELFNVDTPSTDVPGSDCMDGYENDDGLCVFKNITDISLLGSPEVFITKLNEIREKLADEKRIENMHEMSWSEGLAILAEGFEWDDSNPPSGDEFISFRSDNYRNLPEILERLSNEYLEKGEDEKKEFLEGNNSTKCILSLISPSQQFLGCSKKYSLQDTHILCLIGPQLELKLESDPTSKCALGFEKSENSNFCVFKKSDSAEVTYLGHPEEFVENLNVLRRKYSKKYNVPDMNQLIWTPELSKTAESLTWPNTSKWEDLNKKYRFTVVQSYRNPIEFLEELNEEDYEHSENHRDLEFMIPGQKMIGCSIKMENSKNFILCLIGPQGNYKLWDRKSEKSPGSECSNGSKNEDGLCISTEKIDYFGSKIDFLDWTNDLRLQYADRYEIKNMHKLIWSEELTEISNLLEFSNSRQNYSNYRIVILPSYSEFPKILEFELIDFIASSELTGISENFDSSNTTNHNLRSAEIPNFEGMIPKILEKLENWNQTENPGFLEFLNPNQKFLGCSIRKMRNLDFPILCVIGNESNFELWNFDSNEIPGSNCSIGYEDFYGLCAPEGTKDSQMTSTTSSSTSIPTTEEIQTTTTSPEPPAPTPPPTTQKPQKETKTSEIPGESKKPEIPEKQISEVSENSENPDESSNSSIFGPVLSLLVFFICSFWK
ncbi:unnamed protein product [Caenorhabditis nigoni]